MSCWGNHASRSVLWILLRSFVHLSIHPSVCPSAHLSIYLFMLLQHTISELAHQFFLIFCMKLGSYKVRKVTKLIFWEKVLSHQESQKWPQNKVFRALTKIWPIHMYFLYLFYIHQKWCKKDEILSNIKDYYYFILFLAFGQFSDHDHTILINEYQWNYDVIMSKCYLEN